MKCKNNCDELQKEALFLYEFCFLCSGRLQGRRHTHSDNLTEDLQKFIYEFQKYMVSAHVRHVR